MTSASNTELVKLIKQKENRLYYIEHNEEIIRRTSLYSMQNNEQHKGRMREWRAREFALKMRGLCHVCYSSNEEIYNHHGQIICDGCLQGYIKENPEEVYVKY